MSGPNSDIVFINSLNLPVDVGPDCWGKVRSQPAEVSVYLHLQPSFLNASGSSDDVLDSVHYGHLSKAISSKIAGGSFSGVENLVSAINKETSALTAAAAEVRVVVNLPKQILLAEGFLIDTITPMWNTSSFITRTVSVKDLTLPVLIGVNPPEREAKQRVISNIVFHERPCTDPRPLPDYPAIVADIVKGIDSSSYLTLEKFVMEITRTACLASEDIDRVTVRSQKPSALSFAHSSGVEITRRKADFL